MYTYNVTSFLIVTYVLYDRRYWINYVNDESHGGADDSHHKQNNAFWNGKVKTL